MASKDHKHKLTTVKKWEKELNCNLEYDIIGADVVCLWCVVCKCWEKRIEKVKGFNTNWIHPGAKSIKKDGLKSHLQTNQHKEAERLEKRSKMGAEVYLESVLETTPIGCSLRKLQEKDSFFGSKIQYCLLFSKTWKTIYRLSPFDHIRKKNHVKNIGNSYITDWGCAVFTDYIGKVTKESFAEDFANARYCSVLSDGSTDSAVIEQEVVYVLYISKDGVPVVKYLSIESVENGNDGLKDCISKAFERIGITKFSKRLLVLDVDGANVNTGIHKGLGAKIKEEADWLQLVHCFNHCLELALKDSFSNS